VKSKLVVRNWYVYLFSHGPGLRFRAPIDVFLVVQHQVKLRVNKEGREGRDASSGLTRDFLEG